MIDAESKRDSSSQGIQVFGILNGLEHGVRSGPFSGDKRGPRVIVPWNSELVQLGVDKVGVKHGTTPS